MRENPIGNPRSEIRNPNFFGIVAFLLVVPFFFGCSSTKAPPSPPPSIEEARRTAEEAARFLENEQWPAAARQWEMAAERFELLNDRDSQAIALHNLAQARRAQGDLEAARKALHQAERLNTQLGNTEEWWRNQVAGLQITAQAGQTNELAERFSALELKLAQLKDSQLRALYLNERGLWQQRQGALNQAAETFRTAAELFERQQDPAGMAAVRANQARLSEQQKNFAAAVEGWHAALARFELLGDRAGIARALLGLGRTYLNAGKELVTAEDYLDRALRNCERLRLEPERAEAAQLLAEVRQRDNGSKDIR